MLQIERMTWDSNHYGVEVGKVVLEGGDDPVKAANTIRASGYTCLISRVSAEDHHSIHLLEKLGFKLMDISVELEMNLSHFEGKVVVEGYVVSEANEAMLPALCDIARTSFKTGHFHVDRMFDQKKVDEMYALWVRKCFREGYFVDVAKAEVDPLGFVTSITRNDSVVVELVATAEGSRRRGVARSLLTHRLLESKKKASKAEVAVHLTNIPALRLYENLGFRVTKAYPTYHWWAEAKS